MESLKLILNFAISSVIGIVASYIVWWFTFKHLVPKIRFSDKISKLETKNNPSKYMYRFKFENCGCRNVIDIEVIVKLRIQGLFEDRSDNWEVVYLPTSTLVYAKVAILRPIKKTFQEEEKENKTRGILEIKTYECDYFQNSLFPKEIREKSKNKTLTLDDVMNIGTQSEFQIMMLGTDAFSGARKFFESKVYKKEDIKEGCFDKNSLDVIEKSKEQTVV